VWREVQQAAAAVLRAVRRARRLRAQGAYQAPRQAANTAMMAALDGLKRVFEPQEGLLSSLRGVGLDALNAAPAVKQRIMRYAMGV